MCLCIGAYIELKIQKNMGHAEAVYSCHALIELLATYLGTMGALISAILKHYNNVKGKSNLNHMI
jgi:hypothetical protein